MHRGYMQREVEWPTCPSCPENRMSLLPYTGMLRRMTADSNPSGAIQAPAVVKVLRWSVQSPVRLFVVYCGALAAVLLVVALKALAWGVRFHLLPDYWSGVYQQHPVQIALIFAGVSVVYIRGRCGHSVGSQAKPGSFARDPLAPTKWHGTQG